MSVTANPIGAPLSSAVARAPEMGSELQRSVTVPEIAPGLSKRAKSMTVFMLAMTVAGEEALEWPVALAMTV